MKLLLLMARKVPAWVFLILFVLTGRAWGQSQNVTVQYGIQINVPPPIVLLSPTTLGFGSIVQGSSSSSQPVTLQNTGRSILAIASIATSAQYSQTNNCGSSLAISATCTINVTFSPTGTGSISGTLTFTDSAQNSPQVVTLSGTATSSGGGGTLCGSSTAFSCTLGWAVIPNTNIRPLCPSYAEIQSVEGCSAMMADWSGGLYDTVRDRLVIEGGGHNGYFGNETYSINLSANPVTRTLLRDASHGSAVSNVGSCPEAYTDGNPSSRHTYSGLLHLPTQDRYLMYSGSKSNCGFFSGATWLFNPNNATWTNTGASGPNPGSNGSQPLTAYDSVTDNVYLMENNAVVFWRYNTAAQTWTILNSNIASVCQSSTQTASIDPGRRLYFCIGAGAFSKIGLNSPFTGTNLTGSGCSALASAPAPGFVYDPVMQRMVGWAGGNVVYIYNPDTDSCTTQTFTGGPPSVTGGPCGTSPTQCNGTYGRFAYSPNWGLFVVTNEVDANAYTLRLDAPADTDFYARCHAPGVFMCQGLNTPSDISGDYGDLKGTVIGGGQRPQVIDNSIFRSGTGSLRCDVLTLGSSSKCDDAFFGFTHNITGAGNTRDTYFGANQDFYVQWSQRMTAGYIDSGEFKLVNIGAGDPFGCTHNTSASCGAQGSCNALEVVTQNTQSRKLPQMYNSCPSNGSASHGGGDPFEQGVSTLWNTSNFYFENGTPPTPRRCYYQQEAGGPAGGFDALRFPPTGDCFLMVANEWATYQVHIHMGSCVNNEWTNSHVDLWVAHEGQPSEHVMDWGPYALSSNTGCSLLFGKVWLTPYNTTGSTNTGSVYYDNVVVSTTRIPDPRF